MPTKRKVKATAPRKPVRQISRYQDRRMVQARFEAQELTSQNYRQWAGMNALAFDAVANPMVRRILRMKSRQEFHNNPVYQGIALSLADYVIGHGPRLQMLTPDKQLNKAIEDGWSIWAREIKAASKFHTSRLIKCYNGEHFLVMRDNPKLCHPVKLDLIGIEADQVSSPFFGQYPSQYPDQYFDGVVLDPWGVPEKYHILRQHPGAFGAFMILNTQYETFDAKYVLHDFRKIADPQQRGIPEATSCLEDLPEIRRYGKAVLGSAEAAARWGVTVETDQPPQTETDLLVEGEGPRREWQELDRIPLADGIEALILPKNYKAKGFHAEQPTTTFPEFMNSKVANVARCFGMPLFIVTLDARQANMASAYVVMQPFTKRVQSERALDYEPKFDRLFDEWMREARLVPGYLPPSARVMQSFPHAWQWPKIGSHADPLKVAKGRETSIANCMTSIPLICAEDGEDYQDVLESNARWFGVSVPQLQKILLEKFSAAPGNAAPDALEPDDDPEPLAPLEVPRSAFEDNTEDDD